MTRDAVLARCCRKVDGCSRFAGMPLLLCQPTRWGVGDWHKLVGAGVAAGIVLTLFAPIAVAHEEREVDLPDGTGSVPEHRAPDEATETLLVCGADAAEFEERIADFPADLRQRNLDLVEPCQDGGLRTIQGAVDAVSGPGPNIYLLPGEYHEEPSRPEPTGECADLDRPWANGDTYQVLEYDDQVRCPHNQNLIMIAGVEDLQIEG